MATTSGSQSLAGNFSFRNLLDCCCDRDDQRNCKWLLKCLPFVIPALLVGTAAVLLFLRFAVTPHVKAYVEDARLNSFSSVAANAPPAASAGAGAYNISISVALTVRNLNGAMDIRYTRPLVAAFLFDDRRLYNVTVADQGHKHRPLRREAHVLHTGGEAAYYVLDAAAVAEFEKQNATGLLKVEMRLSGEIATGIGNKQGLDLSCPLTLRRPAPPGPDIVVFHEVNCEPDKPKKIVF